MREPVTRAKLQEFMEGLARRSQSEGRVFFTGGATALSMGLREQTIDLDIKLDPEPRGAFQAIAELKERLQVSVELAAPSDFIPVAPNWQEKSIFIARHGPISFYHFDLRAQILSKIERGYAHDLEDARGFQKSGEITDEQLRDYFQKIRPMLSRFPAVDPNRFEEKLRQYVSK